MGFSYTLKTQKGIEQVILDITTNLSGIKFGVLGTLNFKEIFAKKGIDFQSEYRLLEICEPATAKQVLESDPDIGLLLPCTIAVYEKGGENFISLARPTSLIAVAENPKIESIGKEIEVKLVKVLDDSK